jgi:hypothetical protein
VAVVEKVVDSDGQTTLNVTSPPEDQVPILPKVANTGFQIFGGLWAISP